MTTSNRRPPFPLLLALPTIAFVLSGIITVFNVGVAASDFIQRWLLSFLFALPVLPFALLVALAIERVLEKSMASASLAVKRLAASVITALIIEFCLATVVTWSNLGGKAVFGSQWALAFFRSLPIGFVIALLMNFVIKPRYLGSKK